MKELPSILNVKNKDKFPVLYYNRVLCYLRKDIYEHVIRMDENNYFDLEKFGRNYFDGNNREDLMEKLSVSIMKELKSNGWNCKISFGGTALFIYSTDKPPHSCWDDGL